MPAAAQWPDRPVRLLVPVGAGGAADTLSRNLASGFSQVGLTQPMVVENRTGAGGTAFTPIIHVANLPAVILIRPSLPYRTLAEFVAAAKQQPGKFNYASAGLGNWTHLFMSYLNSRAGIEQVNVVYRSGAEMLTSLLRGDADTAIITVSTSLGQVRDGKIRALAGASMRPMKQLPDVPPAGQTIPGFDVSVWHGIVGPAGMDAALVARINGVFNQVLQVPQVRTAITEAQAAEIVGGTPRQFDAFIKGELKRWPEVVKAAGIKPE